MQEEQEEEQHRHRLLRASDPAGCTDMLEGNTDNGGGGILNVDPSNVDAQLNEATISVIANHTCTDGTGTGSNVNHAEPETFQSDFSHRRRQQQLKIQGGRNANNVHNTCTAQVEATTFRGENIIIDGSHSHAVDEESFISIDGPTNLMRAPSLVEGSIASVHSADAADALNTREPIRRDPIAILDKADIAVGYAVGNTTASPSNATQFVEKVATGGQTVTNHNSNKPVLVAAGRLPSTVKPATYSTSQPAKFIVTNNHISTQAKVNSTNAALTALADTADSIRPVTPTLPRNLSSRGRAGSRGGSKEGSQAQKLRVEASIPSHTISALQGGASLKGIGPTTRPISSGGGQQNRENSNAKYGV